MPSRIRADANTVKYESTNQIGALTQLYFDNIDPLSLQFVFDASTME